MRMSSFEIVFRTLVVAVGFCLLAWLCSACGGTVEQAPDTQTASEQNCTTSSDTTAYTQESEAVCGAGHVTLVRCAIATDNIDPGVCRAPEGDTTGRVWCCK